VAFGDLALPRLRSAVDELSWLLSHGYAVVSSLKLVGDRWSLTERQRKAVRRCSCSDEQRNRRDAHEAQRGELSGRRLLIDGFNVLTTLEAALGGGIVLRGRDRCHRDLAGVHGTYRRVEETVPAIQLIGNALECLGVPSATFYLDSPVSNSGRLRAILLQAAAHRDWNWDVELVLNPDSLLVATTEVVASADSAILDHCQRWFPLTGLIVEAKLPDAWVVNLSDPAIRV
jgi:hypothetical protein